MDLQKRFSDAQLQTIIEEATIYMCACPAQVAVSLRQLRELIRYQTGCQQEEKSEALVHQKIAQAGSDAHAIMEICMDEILTIEGWDRETLKMPEGLRKLRDDLILGDE